MTRPAGVARPALVLAILGLAFLGVSRTSGSGWLVVLTCGVAGCLVVATAWPLVSLTRAALRVAAPADGTVGRALALDVELGGGGTGLQVRLLDPPGPAAVADAPARGALTATPLRRGVVEAVELELRSAAPLGLVTWRRRLRAPLARPLEVGPAPHAATLADLAGAAGAAPDALPGRRRGSEDVRGVRAYAPGDAQRLVHWPATARWGEVMVKELGDPDVPHLALVVDLRGPAEAAETAASRAAGLARAALAAGTPVTMLTCERAGGVADEVSTPTEAGRRLARAVAGTPPDGPVPAGALVVRVTAVGP